jgi:ribokinase
MGFGVSFTDMSKILVIGSLNADLVVRASRFPSPGETIQGENLVTIPGGKGANQAVAAARLGAHVAMIGRVGSDAFGSTLIDNLDQNRVDTHGIIKDDSTATGAAVIIVDSYGQNSIVLSPGANVRLNVSDINADTFAGSSLLLLQFEIPIETVVYSAKQAKEKGLTVLLNPAPARSLSDDLIRVVDYIVPNETELGLLTGKPIGDFDSVEAAGRTLLSRGAKNIIVTLGEKGALILNKEGIKLIPAFNVKVLDTTAAGDAFIGGMSVGLMNGKSLGDAVQYGCACGALAVTKFGAQPSLPTLEEVNKLLMH